MNLLKPLLPAVMVAIVASLSIVPAEAQWMENYRPAMRDVKKMKRAGMMPASMSCRNHPNAGSRLKPEVSFKTKRNTGDQAWVVLAYFGDLDWKPGKVGQKTAYRKLYGKRFGASGSGKTFNCSLWVGPKGSLKAMSSTRYWARSGGSVVSMR